MNTKTGTALQEGEQLFLSYKLDEAYAIFSELAEAGNARAMYFIGELYWQGFGLAPVNHVMAYEWAKKGAKAGDVLCKLCMLLNMEELDGKKTVTADEIEEKIRGLVPTIKALAQEDDAFAQYELGHLYKLGKGLPQSDKDSKFWMEKSAAAGHYGAMSKLFQDAYTEDRYDEAFTWCEKLAHMGRVYAMYILSIFYKEGLGCSVDLDKSFKWTEKAAMAGYPEAQLALGKYYNEQYDADESMFWFEKAAEQGISCAQIEVAYNYLDGSLVTANPEKACYWANQAAKQGSVDGKFLLAQCYWEGLGIDMNQELAMKLLDELGQSQNNEVVFSVGRMYANYGMLDKAKFFIEKAASLGLDEAKEALKAL